MVNSLGTHNLSMLSKTELSCINPKIELPLTFARPKVTNRPASPSMIEQSSAAKGLAAAEFWQTPKDVLYCALGSGPDGLSQAEADQRLVIFGANRADASQSRSVLRKLGQRLWNPLIAMLLAAALVSGVSGDVGSFAIIATVLSLSLTLDIVQEHRAELTAEALRDSVAIQADAVRDRKDVTIPVTAHVPGDVVKLRIGDLIPADGIVLDSRELQVNEALMTGGRFRPSRRVPPAPRLCQRKRRMPCSPEPVRWAEAARCWS
ncbi:cation-transporting P-type ATPase [Bradyrhizobium centrolobii]|nr:cation-transporting P-type ATPase [Bradyrhizobium centrolobii]